MSSAASYVNCLRSLVSKDVPPKDSWKKFMEFLIEDDHETWKKVCLSPHINKSIVKDKNFKCWIYTAFQDIHGETPPILFRAVVDEDVKIWTEIRNFLIDSLQRGLVLKDFCKIWQAYDNFLYIHRKLDEVLKLKRELLYAIEEVKKKKKILHEDVSKDNQLLDTLYKKVKACTVTCDCPCPYRFSYRLINIREVFINLNINDVEEVLKWKCQVLCTNSWNTILMELMMTISQDNDRCNFLKDFRNGHNNNESMMTVKNILMDRRVLFRYKRTTICKEIEEIEKKFYCCTQDSKRIVDDNIKKTTSSSFSTSSAKRARII